MFQLTSNDTESLEVYPKAGNVKTIAEYLHQTDDSLLVLFPARQRLERSIAKYKKSTENLREQIKKTEDLGSRLDQMQQLLQAHDTDLTHLKRRLRVSDEKRLAAYEGNLMIEVVKRLSDTHNVESEVRGNDPEACKKKLVGAAEALISMFGTGREVKGHSKENEEQVNRKWETATGLPSKYMDAVRKFEKKVEARNVYAHETAGQLSQLLLEPEHIGGHDYHYLGGLIIFLYGKTIEEMASEEDGKDAQRLKERVVSMDRK